MPNLRRICHVFDGRLFRAVARGAVLRGSRLCPFMWLGCSLVGERHRSFQLRGMPRAVSTRSDLPCREVYMRAGEAPYAGPAGQCCHRAQAHLELP
jgi:hypothetical protein